jgi:hypothetical protein
MNVALKLRDFPVAPPTTVTADMVSTGLAAFFRIMETWQVPNHAAMALLGWPAKSTFFKWKKGEARSVSNAVDLATRISYVLGIFKALEIIYARAEHADRWVATPNMAFGGQSALERMMAGQITDLAAVREYLDSVQGGW